MIRVRRLNHVSLLVADTARALDFYHELLGLAVSDARPDLGFPGAWLDLGNDQQIHLLELTVGDDGQRPEHGSRDRHVALDIDDLDEVVRVLSHAAVSYTLSRSGRRALFCRDPDGNALELVERQ